MKPLFIVLEGGEGSGKSTMLAALQHELGAKAILTREPGGSPYGEVIREVTLKNPLAKTAPAQTTMCLMFASRFDHVANVIQPALAKGQHVVSDRFDGSTFAYQVSAQSDAALEDTFWNLRGKLPRIPDLYVFIDVDPIEGMKRVAGRKAKIAGGAGYDHFDDREVAFHDRVRNGYLKFFKNYKLPHIIIDANRPLETVKADFISQINTFIAAN
ncbi:MAG TPA: dTMP kinase [Candidatus Paceibacterota bacterium]